MHKKYLTRKPQAGFTLVELLVTFAIVATIVTAALPAVQEMMNNGRVKSVSNQAYAWMSLARTEAMKRGAVVTLNSKGACADFLMCGAQIFVDCNADGVLSAGTDCDGVVEEVLHSSDASSKGITMLADVGSSSTLHQSMTFDSLGRLKGSSGSFVLKDSEGDIRRKYTVSITGNITREVVQ